MIFLMPVTNPSPVRNVNKKNYVARIVSEEPLKKACIIAYRNIDSGPPDQCNERLVQ